MTNPNFPPNSNLDINLCIPHNIDIYVHSYVSVRRVYYYLGKIYSSIYGAHDDGPFIIIFTMQDVRFFILFTREAHTSDTAKKINKHRTRPGKILHFPNSNLYDAAPSI